MDQPAGIGHNQPKPMTPAEVTEFLADACKDLFTRQAEIGAGVERFLTTYPSIPNDDIAGKASDFAGPKGAMAAFLKLSKARHTESKEPFLTGGRAVDAFFAKLNQQIEADRSRIKAVLEPYLIDREEKARAAARAEAQRKADEAQAALDAAAAKMDAEKLEQAAGLAGQAERMAEKAEAPAAQHSRVQGEFGGPTSLRTSWQFDEAASDLMALAKAVVEGREPLHYLAFATTRIGQAVRSDKVRAIEGCVIKEVKSI